MYIQRALSPAKITSIKLDDETKRASVYMKPDQVSLAIGKGGYNIRLAGKLQVMKLMCIVILMKKKVKMWILKNLKMKLMNGFIEEFKKIGCDTAKSVLDIPMEELVNRTDLEEETIKEVIKILKSEFE